MKTIILAALGECVHVAGIVRFLRLAESVGWRTVFLGPAVPIEQVLEAARREKADLVGVSYRLTPESGERLLAEFAEEADDLRSAGVQFAFGGTPPLADRARKLGFFEHVFEGGELTEDVLAYLKGQSKQILTEKNYPQSTIERIAWKAPYPIIRHHFGLPTLVDTTAGIKQVADARVLDVISLGIDQDAQANFFHPERQNPHKTLVAKVRVVYPCEHPMIIVSFLTQANEGIILLCAHILGQMTLSVWQKCIWIPSILLGLLSRYSGLTRWTGADRGI